MHLLADRQGTGTCVDQCLGQLNLPLGIRRNGEPVGHHELAAGDPFPQAREVGGVGPGDPVAQACGARQKGQAQLGFGQQFGHGDRHMWFLFISPEATPRPLIHMYKPLGYL